MLAYAGSYLTCRFRSCDVKFVVRLTFALPDKASRRRPIRKTVEVHWVYIYWQTSRRRCSGVKLKTKGRDPACRGVSRGRSKVIRNCDFGDECCSRSPRPCDTVCNPCSAPDAVDNVGPARVCLVATSSLGIVTEYCRVLSLRDLTTCRHQRFESLATWQIERAKSRPRRQHPPRPHSKRHRPGRGRQKTAIVRSADKHSPPRAWAGISICISSPKTRSLRMVCITRTRLGSCAVGSRGGNRRRT